MSVTSITYTTQGSGTRRRFIFKVTPSVGEIFESVIETSDPLLDPATLITPLQTRLDDELARDEVESWLADTEKIANPIHAVRPRYLSTWRARYKEAVKAEHRRLGYKMHREVLAGTFTNPQMNSAWNMTNPERTAFLGRVQLAHDAWVTLEAEVGE